MPTHDDKPRDRLIRDGADGMKLSELLGATLGNSAKKVEVAERLLRRYDGNLVRLADESPQALAKSIGLGQRDAAVIVAVFEVAKRWARFLPTANPQIRNAADVAQFLMPFLRGEQQEVLYVLCLNAKNVITNHAPVFVGTLNASLIHPREVFRFAVENSAASIILAHNHPSGDPTPSREDVTITKLLVDAGRTLEIPLLDHVILGDNRFESLKESGKMV
ncbi:MAG: DNA repair protein RadC [Candidatus Poribacteria bacterium]|nr:DNA repair protein RadC [Candidatus Poribacteria bacterium]